MASKKLDTLLEERNIPSLLVEHEPAYTAQEVAASSHVSGKVLVKTVILRIEDRLAMAVLHAKDRLDLDKLRRSLHTFEIRLATEAEIRQVFVDCEPGAVVPFGNLYGMEVFLEEDVPTDGDIVFSPGTHHEITAIPYSDFSELVHPITVHMTATVH